MLAISKVDSAQRNSIIAAAAPSHDHLAPRSTLNDSSESVTYEIVAMVVRQWIAQKILTPIPQLQARSRMAHQPRIHPLLTFYLQKVQE